MHEVFVFFGVAACGVRPWKEGEGKVLGGFADVGGAGLLGGGSGGVQVRGEAAVKDVCWKAIWSWVSKQCSRVEEGRSED